MSVAVLDLETTGLRPGVDRVVEVGVVLLDDRGEVEGEFCTLVNPGRDVGPTSVHGISARDVADAPAFADIAGYLSHLLAGRLLVAHNALFDLRFLGREFGRAGLPIALSPSLCTMRLAPLFFGAGTRSLQALCDYMSIPLEAHAALNDARATAELLIRMLASDLGTEPLIGAGLAVRFAADGGYEGFEPLDAVWADLVARAVEPGPCAPCDPCPSVPRDAATARSRRRDGYLGGLVAALPALDGAPPSMAPYLTVLDEALEDRLVSITEADQLFSLAAELGCGADHVRAAHRLYLDALATTALADDIVTDAELADLRRVAELLGMESRDVDVALTMVRSGAKVSLPRRPGLFSPGDKIVFTGEMSRSRADLEQAARDAGLQPMSSVSGKTSLLVCADPDSQSGKARKARSLGVRVIGEAVFWESLSLAGTR
ncbi:exonuclease domain-containing protein [Modestobacter sp. VKM Ac-2984]|uniref:exonuclease domain-containing protein n=1 Tax=Modestobacter sp. VKM Ac-2984 TaxID=3004138 RepID=UPI0022AA568A|nr:exonuclease domain-containing protein [Modestobacter sp. VKM Ac-2984]MCZ2817894.1 exonuclease domain-containing protein [Modestobacter sp. VKM Ac-2984]